MEKDFCSKLFTNLENNVETSDLNKGLLDNDTNFARNRYQITEDVIKLHYKYPINFEFSDTNHINCSTQKYNYDNLSLKNSLLVPFYLDEIPLKKRNHGILLSDFDQSNGYTVHCKSKIGIFLPQYFCNGHRGKCVYIPDEDKRLTPIEFQNYSGSTNSDWKDVIKIYNYELNQNLELRKNRMNRNSKLCSIKNLNKNGIFTVHSPLCDCNKIYEEKETSRSINLFSTFFLDSFSKLVVARSTNKSSNVLEIDLFNRQKKPKSYDINFLKHYSKSDSTLTIEDSDNYQIIEIDVRTFDEENYFTNTTSNSICDAYLNFNYESKCFKTIYLGLNEEKNGLDYKILNQIEFDKQRIDSISGSNLIRGECALLTNHGNVLLANELTSNEYNMNKIAQNIEPKFYSNSSFKKVSFGSQPRLFVYTDYSQIMNIDSRIKSSLNLISKEIFTSLSSYLEPNELISQMNIVKNDYNNYLVCCSKTLMLIDERYSKHPLLSWKHFMKTTPRFMSNTNLNSNRNLIICSDTNELYMYQYSKKENQAPKGCEFDKKLNRPIDIMKKLPDTYDKRLDRYLKNRLNSPILSIDLLRYNDSFAIFQFLENQDLYYQGFKLIDSQKEKKISHEYELGIYRNWTDSFQKLAISEKTDLVKNISMNDSDLDEYVQKFSDIIENDTFKNFCTINEKFCQTCTVNSINGSSQECSKCPRINKERNIPKANLEKNLKWLDEINIQKFNESSNNFTKKLLNIWHD